MKSWQRKTILRSVKSTGIGVHSGEKTRMVLNPAKSGQGICFRKNGKGSAFQASWRSVTQTCQRTELTFEEGFRLSTVEHLLAACQALGVTDLLVDVWGDELPIYDGSAHPFVELLDQAGFEVLPGEREWIVIKNALVVTCGKSQTRLEPGAPCFDVVVPLEHNIVQQSQFFPFRENFSSQIARARTFSNIEQIDMLRRNGFIKGGTLASALVLNKGVPLNPGGWRMPQECAKHKILDCIGDFALLGYGFYGKMISYAPGHTLNTQVLRTLMSTPEAFDIVPSSQLLASPEIQEKCVRQARV